MSKTTQVDYDGVLWGPEALKDHGVGLARLLRWYSPLGIRSLQCSESNALA
jgi:hypothetical protein